MDHAVTALAPANESRSAWRRRRTLLPTTLGIHDMRRLALRYPSYGWQSNAGYGTAQHCEAIALRGPTPHHRRSFGPVAQFTLSLPK